MLAMRVSSGTGGRDLRRLPDQSGQDAAENGDVQLGGVGEVLEHGARGDTRHLGDVADDRRDLSRRGEGEGRRDDRFARAGDAVTATGRLELFVVQGLNVH